MVKYIVKRTYILGFLFIAAVFFNQYSTIPITNLWLSDAMAFGGSSDASKELKAVEELIKVEKWDAALEELATLYKKNQKNADVLNYMGYVYRKKGNFDKSYDFYQLALKQDGKHRGALEYLGELYIETNRPDKAVETYRKLKSICGYCTEAVELKDALKAAKVNY